MSDSSDPDQAWHSVGLIWLQTGFKGYRQMTPFGKELISLDKVHMSEWRSGIIDD